MQAQLERPEVPAPAPRRGQTVVGNAMVLVIGQPVTWSITILFLVLVPRVVGPASWGDLTLALAIAGAANVAIDLGLVNLLIKEVGRDRDAAADRVGAALVLRGTMALVAFVAVLIAISVARFSPHLQLVVILITLGRLATSAVGPAVAALQGMQKMVYTTVGAFVATGVGMLGSIVVVRGFSAGVVGVAWAFLVAAVVAALMQAYFLRRMLRVRPVLSPDIIRGLVIRGLPFYATVLSFTIYAWADTFLLAMFSSPTVVGWYGSSTRLIAATGFIPVAVTTAVFPALSRAHALNRSEMVAFAKKAMVFVTSIGLPCSIGLALVGPSLIHTIYGASFDEAGPVTVILALTLVPVFVATLASSVLFATDRQVRWTVAMAAGCALNIVTNVIAIPLAQRYMGNGAIGAAWALLVTDTLVGVAAVALLPRDVLRGIASDRRRLALNVVATAGMAAAVVPLLSTMVVFPVLAGVVVYAALAMLLSVYERRDIHNVYRIALEARSRIWKVSSAAPRYSEVVAAGAPNVHE